MDERIRASPASAGKGVDERILAVLRERMREADGSHGLAGDTQLSFQGMVDVCRRTFELPETEFSDAQLWTLFAQLSDSSDFMLVSALDEFLENDGTSALVARPFSDADSSSPAESQRQEVDWGNEREQPVLDQTLSNSTCNAEPARAFAHGELHALHVQMLAACSLPALAALGHASSSSFSSPHASSTDGAGAGVLLDEAQLARFVRRDLKLDEVTMPPDRIHVLFGAMGGRAGEQPISASVLRAFIQSGELPGPPAVSSSRLASKQIAAPPHGAGAEKGAVLSSRAHAASNAAEAGGRAAAASSYRAPSHRAPPPAKHTRGASPRNGNGDVLSSTTDGDNGQLAARQRGARDASPPPEYSSLSARAAETQPPLPLLAAEHAVELDADEHSSRSSPLDTSAADSHKRHAFSEAEAMGASRRPERRAGRLRADHGDLEAGRARDAAEPSSLVGVELGIDGAEEGKAGVMDDDNAHLTVFELFVRWFADEPDVGSML